MENNQQKNDNLDLINTLKQMQDEERDERKDDYEKENKSGFFDKSFIFSITSLVFFLLTVFVFPLFGVGVGVCTVKYFLLLSKVFQPILFFMIPFLPYFCLLPSILIILFSILGIIYSIKLSRKNKNKSNFTALISLIVSILVLFGLIILELLKA